MKISIKDKKKWIERIHTNKHNAIPAVKYVIYQPFTQFQQDGVFSPTLPVSIREKIGTYRNHAESIMLKLQQIGNSKGSEEEQCDQLVEQIQDVEKNIVPTILGIIAFFQSLIDNPSYFGKSDLATTAFKRIIHCVLAKDSIINLLQTLDNTNISQELETHPLYELLENLDKINADIIYDIPNRMIEVKISKDFFKNVIQNIKENIEKHAFPTYLYKEKNVLQKKVRVSYAEDETFHIISILNNGEPFKGDLSKVFTYGYHFGSTGHSGFGLNSAKEYLNKIGGDIEMETYSDDDFKVGFIIKIKK